MSEGGNSHLRWPLARASFTHGYLPRFVVIGAQEDAEARLRRELTVRHYRAVVVGPLLSVEPQTYESVSPATRFLLVENPIAVSQSNEVRLVFDRTPSFRTAGYAAGLAVRDEADGAAINALASRIGILLSAHPPGTQDEITASQEVSPRHLMGASRLPEALLTRWTRIQYGLQSSRCAGTEWRSFCSSREPLIRGRWRT